MRPTRGEHSTIRARLTASAASTAAPSWALAVEFVAVAEDRRQSRRHRTPQGPGGRQARGNPIGLERTMQALGDAPVVMAVAQERPVADGSVHCRLRQPGGRLANVKRHHWHGPAIGGRRTERIELPDQVVRHLVLRIGVGVVPAGAVGIDLQRDRRRRRSRRPAPATPPSPADSGRRAARRRVRRR